MVLAVRDDAGGAERAIRSILLQADVDLELVAVDDGSTDGTAATLRALAATDRRLSVLSEPHRGLTRALGRGCAAARAPLIARQDAGDHSEPRRLRRQIDLLRSARTLAFVSCWTRCLGPGGEELQVVTGQRADATPVRLDPSRAPGSESVGPSAHGSAVFRRDFFEAVGGYREEFHLAQDWDLWWRLSELGDFATVPEVLYTRTLSPRSLSFQRGREQAALGRLAREAALARLGGGVDSPQLDRARAVSNAAATRPGDRQSVARGWYFIGALLRARRDPRARHYFGRALRADPLFAGAWVRWLQSWV